MWNFSIQSNTGQSARYRDERQEPIINTGDRYSSTKWHYDKGMWEAREIPRNEKWTKEIVDPLAKATLGTLKLEKWSMPSRF